MSGERPVIERFPQGAGPTVFARLAVVVLACALAGSAYALFSNVSVGEPVRTCGSVFDSLVDRSGWEDWWASDLDDPDDRVRSGLFRTVQCPSTINRRLALVVGLAALAGLLVGLVRIGRPRRNATDTPSLGDQLGRFGRTTSLAGAGLTIAGVIGIVVLTADADSTLFLYTDRLVVAVIGLVVLVPALALFAIGRMLMLIGPHIAHAESDTDDGALEGDRRA